MKKRKAGRIYILPNLFTSLSLFCGFLAINEALNRNFTHSSLVIFIACLFDILDGRVARMTNSSSRFGVEYDSLSDLVSFGVAPAILAQTWSLHIFGRFGLLAAFLYVACGALRLARFNIQAENLQKKHFVGLPIPASAVMLASTVLLCSYLGYTEEFPHISFPLLLYLLAFLMVSNVRYYGFKDLSFVRSKPFSTAVFVILALVVIYTEPMVTLFLISSVYVLSGPVWALLRGRRKIIEEPALEGRDL